MDFNISVTNQPHSEIAALAVFLDRIQTCSIQNFFETFFIDTYNHYETHNDINKLNNIDVYDEHDM